MEKLEKSKVEYKPAYTDDDTGIGFIAYIILQGLIYFVVRGIISTGVPFTKWFYYIYAFLVEGVFGLAVLFVCLTRKRSFLQASGMKKKVNTNLVGLCVGISIVCLLGLGRVSDFFIQILEWMGYSSYGEGIQVTNFGELIMYTLLIALMPAVCEELLFRGLMLNGLAKYGKNIAVFVSAFSFMIMHGSPDQTVHQFILGVIFGYIVYYTGNLWLTVIIHFCNNFFVLVANFIYNISASTSETVETAETISEPLSVGYQIVNYIISIIIIIVSVYLIYSAIKRIVSDNKKLNGLPEYVSEKDRKRLNVLDEPKQEIKESDIDENAIVVNKVGEEPSNPVEVSKPKLSWLSIILLGAGNLYLIIEWIIALVEGFMG